MTLVSMGDVRTVHESPAGGGPVDPRSTARGRLAPVASVSAGTALIGLHASFYGHWLIDDAAITFAYARSVTDGLGPVVQPGAAPVEGFSNPTWLLLLAVGRLVGLFDHGTLFGVPDYVLFPKALALLCCAGILALCHVAARRVLTRAWLVPLAVGGLLAATPSFVIWSYSGLENSLYALLITALAVLLFTAVLDGRLLSPRVALGAGGLAALAALTRPEGLIYAGAYPFVLLGHLSRPTLVASVRYALISTAAFGALVGAYFGWRLIEFGQLLSSPSVAKGQDLPTLTDMTRPGELVAYVGAPAALLLMAVVGYTLATAPWWRGGLLALLVPLGLAVAAYAVLEPDWMEQFRFATPIWVLGALATTLATAQVLRRASTRMRAWLAAALTITLLPSSAAFAESAEDFHDQPNISACYVADRFGRVFNGYADILGLDDASLLLPDLGGSAMTSDLTLVDMAGLTHSRFAELAKEHDKAAQREYVYTEARPTFIHVREPWSGGTGISYDPRLPEDYYPIHFDLYQDKPHGDWVRKDAVATPELLAEVRDYADHTTTWVEQRAGVTPLRDCGPTLRRGQTTPSEPPPERPGADDDRAGDNYQEASERHQGPGDARVPE
ncbi:hypothetical protein [Saccharomonospora saliphila]|uniref:hypothetical protein n=1 Tax=Saccharomonospora saliphila TaxID=369829 RepID=UPI001E5B5F8B|nr:hypothetical protein [Saccharomonospora saliphila]